jgi:hypothetical protein
MIASKYAKVNKRNEMSTKLPDVRKIHSRLKSSAKKRNIEFDLTITDLYQIDFPITCPILGMPLVWNRGEPKDNSVSFDRIDSSVGYTFDNLQVISVKANRAKNNLTLEELKKFALYYA